MTILRKYGISFGDLLHILKLVESAEMPRKKILNPADFDFTINGDQLNKYQRIQILRYSQ